MKLRLHEIELGVDDVQKKTELYQSVLGLHTIIKQKDLTVFNSGNQQVDFNISTHLPASAIAISFICDDLEEIEKRLKDTGLSYKGPFPSHLNMSCIQFKDADGYLIKVNAPGPDSPEWLKV